MPILNSACGQLSRFRRDLQPSKVLLYSPINLEVPVRLTGCSTNGAPLSPPEIAPSRPPILLSLEI